MDTVTASSSRPIGGGPQPARRVTAARLAAWSFVYVFFSNGTPFDAPNRSETCPPL